MTRTAVATDTFTRADGALGANWTNLTPGTTSTPLIVSNHVEGSNGTGVYPCSAYTGASFNADQYALVALVGVSFQIDSYRCGVILRSNSLTDGSRSYYQLTVSYDNLFTFRISKCVAGTFSDLASATASAASTDILLGEVIGTTLNLYLNSPYTSPIVTTTDASLATGKTGLATSAGFSSGRGVDTWEGGNVGAAGGFFRTAFGSGMSGVGAGGPFFQNPLQRVAGGFKRLNGIFVPSNFKVTA